MNQDKQSEVIERLRNALDDLQEAEAEYRLMHDRHGDGAQAAGRAWDLMRRAGDRAREALSRPSLSTPPDDPDEAYQLGKRDGYGEALAEIDRLTGGDGEYRYCLGVASDRHCPDEPAMKAKIVERFGALSTPSVTQAAEAIRRELEMCEWYDAAARPDLCRVLAIAALGSTPSEGVIELIEGLRDQARRESEASKWLADAKTARQTDRDDYPGMVGGYSHMLPEQTLSWKAAEALARLSPLPLVEEGGFQARVDQWLLACFGEEIARDPVERNHRFLEEALELVQAGGCTASEAHQLVDYTFGRPVGEMGQEVGGVMNTLAALCLAHGIDMQAEGNREMDRVSTPEAMAKIRSKQAAKPKHSPLPQAAQNQAAW